MAAQTSAPKACARLILEAWLKLAATLDLGYLAHIRFSGTVLKRLVVENGKGRGKGLLFFFGPHWNRGRMKQLNHF
jgi:hypothetical protein